MPNGKQPAETVIVDLGEHGLVDLGISRPHGYGDFWMPGFTPEGRADVAKAVGEAPLVVGSMIGKEILGGWGAIGTIGSGEYAGDIVDKARSNAYQPRSNALRAMFEGVAPVAEKIGEKILPIREKYENVMNPLIGEKAAGALYAGSLGLLSVAPIPGAALALRAGRGLKNVVRAERNALRPGSGMRYADVPEAPRTIPNTDIVASEVVAGQANALTREPRYRGDPMQSNYEGSAYRAEGFEGGAPRGATAADVVLEEMERKSIHSLDEFGIDDKTFRELENLPADALMWVGRSKEELFSEFGPTEHWAGFIESIDDIADVSADVAGKRILYEDPSGALIQTKSKQPTPTAVLTDRSMAEQMPGQRGGPKRAGDSPSPEYVEEYIQFMTAEGMSIDDMVQELTKQAKEWPDYSSNWALIEAIKKRGPVPTEFDAGDLGTFSVDPLPGGKFALTDHATGDVFTLNNIQEMNEVIPSIRSFNHYLNKTPDPDPVDPLIAMNKLMDKERGSLGDPNASPQVKQTAVRAAARQALTSEPESIGFTQRNLKGERVWNGAPPGVKTEDDIMKLAEEYAVRVERGLDSGLDPDYFYLSGQNRITELSSGPTQANALALSNAITSSEAPVRGNFGWAVQGFEQSGAGYPIHTGKYPNKMSADIEDVFAGRDPHLGQKRQLYGQGLSGEGRKLPPEQRRAPNDRFEIRAFGYKKDSASARQHDFMHATRKIAMDIVNEKRGTNLDVYNIQEVHWAVKRADDMNISIAEAASDNIQESVGNFMFQHSWETVPGTGINQLSGVDLKSHDAALQNIYIDPKTGKDNWVSAFGEPFQDPALVNTPGVFKGVVEPYGYQSNSLIYQSDRVGSLKGKIKEDKKVGPLPKGMDRTADLEKLKDAPMNRLTPGSRDRVAATETTRAYLNLQDAAAGTDVIPSTRKTVQEFGGSIGFDMGRPINQAEAQQVVDLLKKHYDVDAFGVVPTPEGVEIIATGAKGLQKHTKELDKILKSKTGPAGGDFSGTGFYADLPWKERKATEAMLESLTPAMRKHAESPAARVVVKQMHDYYKALPQKPPKGYLDVLKAWFTQGLPGVEALVKQGLAPAAVLGVLAAQQQNLGGTSQNDLL